MRYLGADDGLLPRLPRVWLCLARLPCFFYRFLRLNLSLQLLVLLFFPTVLHRKGLLTIPQWAISLLPLFNLISSHCSCCQSLPSSHVILPLSWIRLSSFCSSKGHFIPYTKVFFIFYLFFLLESDKSNISRNKSLNKGIFLCLKYSFWLHATLGCHLSKKNERPRSLVCKLYESLKFLWAVFHALDSKLSLQGWASAGYWWNRHKTNISQMVMLFFFQGTLRHTVSLRRKMGKNTKSIFINIQAWNPETIPGCRRKEASRLIRVCRWNMEASTHCSAPGRSKCCVSLAGIFRHWETIS